MRIGTVSLIKAPPERAGAWVAYHLNSGIDEMHVFLDDASAETADALAGHPQVHVYRCDDSFWRRWRPNQETKPVSVPGRQISLLRHLLREPPTGLDWLIHIDSDELLWARGGLRESLARDLDGSHEHVQFLPLEAVPTDPNMRDPFLDIHWFKQMDEERQDWARRLRADGTFRGKRYYRGHTRGKPAVRLDGSIRSMRIHGPTPQYRRDNGIRSAESESVKVLHYDAMSLDEWRDKWAERLVNRVPAMGPKRRRQERRFRRAYRSGNAERLLRLYRDEYMLGTWDRQVLRALGMLRKIELPPELFVLPQPAVQPLIPRQRAATIGAEQVEPASPLL